MQLPEDGERLRLVARRRSLPPSVVDRLWKSYQETGEYTRRQGQGRSRMKTPMQDRFLVLLSRRNRTSTAKALAIVLCRATEVHLPDQIVRNKLHYDGMRARRPAQGPVLTAQHRSVRFNFPCMFAETTPVSLSRREMCSGSTTQKTSTKQHVAVAPACRCVPREVGSIRSNEMIPCQ